MLNVTTQINIPLQSTLEDRFLLAIYTFAEPLLKDLPVIDPDHVTIDLAVGNELKVKTRRVTR